ncbi:hypothetical protein J6590_101308 [Homalodisca vitripennis]|nr:hypothetical protein J6590_101308 [Homalodisca vitripennis]
MDRKKNSQMLGYMIKRMHPLEEAPPLRALTSQQGGANPAHGHGRGPELTPPCSKGMLIQRMDMAQSPN